MQAPDIEPIVKDLIEKNPKQFQKLRDGKKLMLGFFVGQVMKQTGGTADPKTVSDLILSKL